MKISIKQKIRWSILTALYYFMRVFPIKKNKIVISNFYGRGFGDNGKYIAKELLSQSVDYDIVWLTDKRDDEMPDVIRISKYLARGSFSIKTIYEEVTAKIWIDNCRKEPWVRKRKKQYYIQTWHGDFGPKRIERDAIDKLSDTTIHAAIRDSKMVDLMVSGSKFKTKQYETVFWYDGKIAEIGSPRCDIIISNDFNQKVSIKQKLGYNDCAKILMYAPTFRDGMCEDLLSIFALPWESVLDALTKRFGGTWFGMLRLHPNLTKLSDKLRLPENVVNVSTYPDIQELLLVCDSLVTDYSSALYEFALTGKPGFIYATDITEYEKERDVYFSLRSTPFPVAQSKDELISNIIKFNEQIYNEQHRAFYSNVVGQVYSRNAAEAIADKIKTICIE